MAKIQIQPINLWVKGEVKTAEVLYIRGIGDDYESAAQNYYELREADVTNEEGNVTSGAILQNGNLDCSGQNYIDWDNSNEWIKSWVAAQLNLPIA